MQEMFLQRDNFINIYHYKTRWLAIHLIIRLRLMPCVLTITNTLTSFYLFDVLLFIINQWGQIIEVFFLLKIQRYPKAIQIAN